MLLGIQLKRSVVYPISAALLWHKLRLNAAQILASASYDDTIKLYVDDPSDDWYCATTLTGHTSTVWTLAWEPDQGKYLASGSDDSTIRLWRRLPGPGEPRFECASVLDGHDGSVYSIAWTPAPEESAQSDGTRHLGWLASSGADGKILVRQIYVSIPCYIVTPGLIPSFVNQETVPGEENAKVVVGHRLLACFDGSHGVSEVNAITWCPRPGGRNLLATAGDDGHVKVWRLSL